MSLLVDERDVKFVLYEQLRVDELCGFPAFAEFSRETFDMALEQAEKLAEREFYAVNRDGDRHGCRYEDGVVTVPEAFQHPYRLYREGGWLAMADPPAVGGQGFPFVIANAAIELFAAGNWSLLMYPGLSHGAARLLQEFGSAELQECYMYKMFSGEWSGTMCMTEPGAGSDVGSLITRAAPRADGSYDITGQKIFISCGMHNLTENIVHMVLARIDGAPSGSKGISIFLVPRLRCETDGRLVDNDVLCAGIEHKMGIHGSATCTLNFGDNGNCRGYLLGGAHQGMSIMFHMMNEARLFVGMQGLGHASAAYLHALRYARNRVQGSVAERMRDADAPRVPIINHPDVRRMLLSMKSSTEALRAMLYFTAYCIDRSRIAATGEERERFQGYVDLLIPLCKSVGSDLGFRVCETAMQIHGGYGYIADCPVEQFLRDCKIASIYEGTNGIQALDLVGRKIAIQRGRLFQNLLTANGEILARIKHNFHLRELTAIYEEAQESLVQVTRFFALQAMTEEFHIPLLYAKPYLELFGDVVMGFLLLWQAHLATRRLQETCRDHGAASEAECRALGESNRSAAFYFGKVAAARFFINQTLTQAAAKARAILRNDASPLEIPDAGFALN